MMDSNSARISELLFKAFEIAINVWFLKDRKDIFKYFTSKISELDICTAVIILDGSEKYTMLKEDVSTCRYLNFQPKFVNIVPCSRCNGNTMHDFLFTMPLSEDTSIYIFIKEDENFEEAVQVFSDLTNFLIKVVESIEAREKLEGALNQLNANLEYFQYLADRLRNALAVILGVAELEDEIEYKQAIRFIKESSLKMKKVLDEMHEYESKTKKNFDEILSSFED
ncbi:histidine kinase dimerization/phospho-acceptor domain-containing protein [Geoglobus acetivorans]|uniref:Signal transduction histidine kinase dimerisation/phosphoacceptor domain-containing protein n=1 Tax=Geoglobus acetivorans TaxID=565033 RepID=A0A0A7GCH7_GEOAI|nr:hypothetical protein GACE_0662 [Geoglobus acetivorans]